MLTTTLGWKISYILVTNRLKLPILDIPDILIKRKMLNNMKTGREEIGCI